MINFLLHIIVSSLTFIMGLALSLLFYYQNQWPAYYEAQARGSLRQIVMAQTLYSVTKGKGKFTDLQTLGREGLISPDLASGQKDGYLFTCEPILVKGNPPLFDAMAKPIRSGLFRSGYRSYYSSEIFILWERYGTEPPRATVEDRKPKDCFVSND